MKFKLLQTTAVVAAIVTPTLFAAAPALAQAQAQAQNNNQLSEIIVTARKRQESILNVPVIETAIPKAKMDRLQVIDLKDVATLVPTLRFGDSFLSTGTVVSLRGVGTTAYDPGVDQSVALNIDGMSIGTGLAYMSGMFDVGQVEVLKGPQSLFYGKGSPGGVVSIRTADPTNTPEIIARAGYEFEAGEKRFELIASGPITDTLKGRISGYVDKQNGYFNQIVGAVPADAGGRTSYSNLQPQKDYMIRGTLLWNPSSVFDARLKVVNAHMLQYDQAALQLANCPDGTAPVGAFQFLNPADNCKIDRNISWVEMDPSAFPLAQKGGQGFLESTQTYGTLEMNYRPRPDVTVTSTTGVYLVHEKSSFSASSASYFGSGIWAANGFQRNEFTQELRANSDFSGPFNFTAGGFLERGRISDQITVGGNTDLINYGLPLPAELQQGTNIIHIYDNAVFAQGRYKFTPQLELAAGVRWSSEQRDLTGILQYQPGEALGVVPKPVPEISSKTWSPEVTLTYKPTADITTFGSFKIGYLSGSYAIGTPPVANFNNSFGDEKVEGGEIGMKSRWLDRSLQFNVSAYYYKYTGLQVGAILPVEGGIPVTTVVNAGSATVKGIEADVVYQVPKIDNLVVNASLNYNNAVYNELDHVPCYGGQTIAAGCNEQFDSNVNNGMGGYTTQNESGLGMVRAPKWAANFGFSWEYPMQNGMKFLVTNSQTVSSDYVANLGKPYIQPAFIKSDLSLTLQGPNDKWEFAFIGKNLSGALTTGNCVNSNGRGGDLLPQNTGTATVGPAGVDQLSCVVDRGRELWLRATWRPLN
jgi:iron complex outermembrane receptor protein